MEEIGILLVKILVYSFTMLIETTRHIKVISDKRSSLWTVLMTRGFCYAHRTASHLKKASAIQLRISDSLVSVLFLGNLSVLTVYKPGLFNTAHTTTYLIQKIALPLLLAVVDVGLLLEVSKQ